jgi:hypothetical protein
MASFAGLKDVAPTLRHDIRGFSMVTDQFRDYAAGCLRLAAQVVAPEQKAMLLSMAHAWQRLAHFEESISESIREARLADD